MKNLTRRHFLASLMYASVLPARASEPPRVLREQVAGEWCFLKIPQNWSKGEVVLILHGAGEWVSSTSSSWETQPGATALMQALLDAGYAIAQSNGAARNGNGMWGNADTQTANIHLADWLTNNYRPRNFHALAVSAGNLVLTNLLLNRRMHFASAVMLAPCLSIASEYRCPGNNSRVKTIAEAFHFTPASQCPGDPEHDVAFLSATADADPMRRLQSLSDAQLRSVYGGSRLLAIYESGDPRVPPSENILPFSQRLQQADVPLDVITMEANTHGSQELFEQYTPRILSFL